MKGPRDHEHHRIAPGRPAMTATVNRQAADLLGGEAGPDYRPDLNPANADVRSWVYLVHLDPPYKHAAHYSGSASTAPATAPGCSRCSARPAGPGTSRGPGPAGRPRSTR